MPALPLEWMDQTARHLSSIDPWAWALTGYEQLAPRVHVKGRMALILLGAVLWAFLWLLWRAYTVIQTPNDDLVDKLGLDIPPEPLVTLEEIAPRQITISWKPLDSASSTTAVQEHHIEVNGRIAGVTKKHETMAVVSQLAPGMLYDVRVFSVSPGRFQTASAFLRLRTSASDAETKADEKDASPVVKGLTPRGPPGPVMQPAPAMAREHSGGQTIARRGTGARKASPAGLVAGTDIRGVEEDSSEDLAALSQQFQRVSQETETIDLQIEDETKEFETALKERESKLMAVKQDMKERDEASGDLRKQVNRAEALNRSLQSEKSKKEKLLKDMESKRRRKKDEIAKWEERAQSIDEEIDGINKQKEAIRRRTESEVQEIKEKNAEEQREIQAMQEENMDKAMQLKELQEERRRNAIEEETDESQEVDRLDQEREARHHHTIATLRQQYQMILQDVQRAQQEHILARQRLAMYDTARRAGAGPQSQYIDRDYGLRDKTNRRMRHTSSHGSNVSSPRAAFVPEPFNSVNQAVTNSSPMAGRAAAHLFNLGNGTTFPVSFPQINIPQPPNEEDEDISVAAPMSPRAEILLPHDLLGDESADELHADDEDEGHDYVDEDGIDASPFPTMPSARPPPPPGRDSGSPESLSPRSTSSPRSFASPREDFTTLGKQDEQPQQAEEKPGGGHKRLTSMSNLFSFNRQRGKTSADELPVLGSLKGTQSQSFPRKVEDFDATIKPQRRLSYGGTNWVLPGSGPDAEMDKTKPVSGRRGFPSLLGRSSAATRNYDPFAPRNNSMDPGLRGGSSSPRPGSTYSFDKMPRPSMEDAFRAWAFDRPGARNSPLVPDWASSISRSHSRRPSIGYGSTTNLSLHVTDDGEFIEPKRDSRPLQAPIGTRPTSSQQSQRPTTPKLNPNAPSFTTMFSFGKSKDKNKEKDKPKTRDGKPTEQADNGSPPEPRKSRDGHSIAATTSTFESHDSLERTSSAQGTASLESTPATRPTIFSKISRKASSNKFGSWKDKSSNLFSRKEATTPTGDIEEERSKTPDAGTGSTEHLGRSLESTSSTPVGDEKKGSRTSLGTWSFMRKKTKPGGWGGMKEDLTASEISENSEFQVSESGEDGDGDSLKLDGLKQ